MSEPDQIVIQCPACKGRLRAARASIGTRVGCPTCQAPIIVTDPPAPPPAPMIVDSTRKLGLAPRGGEGAMVESGFKERIRLTSEPTFQVDPDQPTMIRVDRRKQKHGDPLTDWDRKPSAHHHHRHRRGRRVMIGLSIVTGLLALVLAGIFWQRLQHAPGPTGSPPAARGLELQASGDFRDQVWLTAQQFCAASNPEALLPLIREPERVGPLLKRFYNSDNPWIPLPLARRPDLSELEVHRNFVVFQLPLADFGSRPIGLEKTADGFRVDWESFVGYSDLSWTELRRTRPRKPVLIRAVVKPSDYFNLDFPSSSTHHCYQITDLNSDHVLYGYVPISSDIEFQIKKILLTAPTVHAVLRVRYPETSTNDRQLEITEVLEKGWIFREDDLPETPLQVSPLDLGKPPVPPAPRSSSGPTPKPIPGLTGSE